MVYQQQFLTVLEAKSEIKVLADLASGEGSLLGLHAAAFLLWPSMKERK